MKIEKEISCRPVCDLSPGSLASTAESHKTLGNGDYPLLPGGVPNLLRHTQDMAMKSPDFSFWKVCAKAALKFTSQMTLDEFCDLAGSPSGSSSVKQGQPW